MARRGAAWGRRGATSTAASRGASRTGAVAARAGGVGNAATTVGSSNEQQRRHRDELAHRPLWRAEPGQCRSRETSDLRDDFQDDGDRDDQPCHPRHCRDDDHRERAVVGAGQQAPKRAEVGLPRRGTDADEQERHPGDEKQEGERGRETSKSLGKRGLGHCSLPPRLRMSRAEAVLVTVKSPMPMKLRNLGL